MLDKVLPIKYFTWGQYLLFSSKSYSDCRTHHICLVGRLTTWPFLPPWRLFPGDRHNRRYGVASFENLDLGVKRRGNLEPRNVCLLEVRVEKAVHAVRRHSKLTTAVDTELTEHSEHPPNDMALQQSSVITEGKWFAPGIEMRSRPSVGRRS